ncbi:hypothetical protein RRG08_045530 [Elysia crispata]|uniref:Uncharacterized protein n=1 Tax=Elysia crispata TaxID=231223 RepID=A0AAE0YDP1_9GAST|nr:hypothetical protein RRG08_045530 [Elysia crispata]
MQESAKPRKCFLYSGKELRDLNIRVEERFKSVWSLGLVCRPSSPGDYPGQVGVTIKRLTYHRCFGLPTGPV